MHRPSSTIQHGSVLLLALILITPMSGCLGVANMEELKTQLGANDDEPPALPEARAQAAPEDALVGEIVRFSAAASTDPAGAGLEVVWTFGDGATATGVEVTHTYVDVGVYPVTATVTDTRGRSDTANLQVAVSSGNQAPEATFVVEAPAAPGVGDEVVLDASGSSDPDGDALTFSWSLGDGTTASGESVTHTYDAPGAFLVELMAQDPSGAEDSASRIVAVELHRVERGVLNLTDERHRVTLPVANEGRLVVNLTFNASAGVDDLDLVVRDADGERVARANNTTPPSTSGQAWEEIVLTDDILETTAPGSWTVDVVRKQGVQVSYTLRVDQTFPTSGP